MKSGGTLIGKFMWKLIKPVLDAIYKAIVALLNFLFNVIVKIGEAICFVIK